MVQPAGESPAMEQATARKGKPSWPRAGALGGHSLLGTGSSSLSGASHRHLSTLLRKSDGFPCQLERVSAQPVEVKEQGAPVSLFSIQPQHLKPLAAAFTGLWRCVQLASWHSL